LQQVQLVDALTKVTSVIAHPRQHQRDMQHAMHVLRNRLLARSQELKPAPGRAIQHADFE
jgi:hypothetical protein